MTVDKVKRSVKRERPPTNKELLQEIIALLKGGQRNRSHDLNSIQAELKRARRHPR